MNRICGAESGAAEEGRSSSSTSADAMDDVLGEAISASEVEERSSSKGVKMTSEVTSGRNPSSGLGFMEEEEEDDEEEDHPDKGPSISDLKNYVHLEGDLSPRSNLRSSLQLASSY